MNQAKQIAASTCFIYMKYDYNFQKAGCPKEWQLSFWDMRVDESKDRIFLEERLIEVNVTGFNPIPKQVAALEAEKAQALEQYQKCVADINRQLSKLLAIEHNPTQEA